MRGKYDSVPAAFVFCNFFVFLYFLFHILCIFYISHIIFPTRSNYDSLHASARRHISFFLSEWRGCALITRQTFTLSNDDHDHIDDHMLVIIFGDHNIGDHMLVIIILVIKYLSAMELLSPDNFSKKIIIWEFFPSGISQVSCTLVYLQVSSLTRVTSVQSEKQESVSQ